MRPAGMTECVKEARAFSQRAPAKRAYRKKTHGRHKYYQLYESI